MGNSPYRSNRNSRADLDLLIPQGCCQYGTKSKYFEPERCEKYDRTQSFARLVNANCYYLGKFGKCKSCNDIDDGDGKGPGNLYGRNGRNVCGFNNKTNSFIQSQHSHSQHSKINNFDDDASSCSSSHSFNPVSNTLRGYEPLNPFNPFNMTSSAESASNSRPKSESPWAPASTSEPRVATSKLNPNPNPTNGTTNKGKGGSPGSGSNNSNAGADADAHYQGQQTQKNPGQNPAGAGGRHKGHGVTFGEPEKNAPHPGTTLDSASQIEPLPLGPVSGSVSAPNSQPSQPNHRQNDANNNRTHDQGQGQGPPGQRQNDPGNENISGNQIQGSGLTNGNGNDDRPNQNENQGNQFDGNNNFNTQGGSQANNINAGQEHGNPNPNPNEGPIQIKNSSGADGPGPGPGPGQNGNSQSSGNGNGSALQETATVQKPGDGSALNSSGAGTGTAQDENENPQNLGSNQTHSIEGGPTQTDGKGGGKENEPGNLGQGGGPPNGKNGPQSGPSSGQQGQPGTGNGSSGQQGTHDPRSGSGQNKNPESAGEGSQGNNVPNMHRNSPSGAAPGAGKTGNTGNSVQGDGKFSPENGASSAGPEGSQNKNSSKEGSGPRNLLPMDPKAESGQTTRPDSSTEGTGSEVPANGSETGHDGHGTIQSSDSGPRVEPGAVPGGKSKPDQAQGANLPISDQHQSVERHVKFSPDVRSGSEPHENIQSPGPGPGSGPGTELQPPDGTQNDENRLGNTDNENGEKPQTVDPRMGTVHPGSASAQDQNAPGSINDTGADSNTTPGGKNGLVQDESNKPQNKDQDEALHPGGISKAENENDTNHENNDPGAGAGPGPSLDQTVDAIGAPGQSLNPPTSGQTAAPVPVPVPVPGEPVVKSEPKSDKKTTQRLDHRSRSGHSPGEKRHPDKLTRHPASSGPGQGSTEGDAEADSSDVEPELDLGPAANIGSSSSRSRLAPQKFTNRRDQGVGEDGVFYPYGYKDRDEISRSSHRLILPDADEPLSPAPVPAPAPVPGSASSSNIRDVTDDSEHKPDGNTETPTPGSGPASGSGKLKVGSDDADADKKNNSAVGSAQSGHNLKSSPDVTQNGALPIREPGTGTDTGSGNNVDKDVVGQNETPELETGQNPETENRNSRTKTPADTKASGSVKTLPGGSGHDQVKGKGEPGTGPRPNTAKHDMNEKEENLSPPPKSSKDEGHLNKQPLKEKRSSTSKSAKSKTKFNPDNSNNDQKQPLNPISKSPSSKQSSSGFGSETGTGTVKPVPAPAPVSKKPSRRISSNSSSSNAAPRNDLQNTKSGTSALKSASKHLTKLNKSTSKPILKPKSSRQSQLSGGSTTTTGKFFAESKGSPKSPSNTNTAPSIPNTNDVAGNRNLTSASTSPSKASVLSNPIPSAGKNTAAQNLNRKISSQTPGQLGTSASTHKKSPAAVGSKNPIGHNENISTSKSTGYIPNSKKNTSPPGSNKTATDSSSNNMQPSNAGADSSVGISKSKMPNGVGSSTGPGPETVPNQNLNLINDENSIIPTINDLNTENRPDASDGSKRPPRKTKSTAKTKKRTNENKIPSQEPGATNGENNVDSVSSSSSIKNTRGSSKKDLSKKKSKAAAAKASEIPNTDTGNPSISISNTIITPIPKTETPQNAISKENENSSSKLNETPQTELENSGNKEKENPSKLNTTESKGPENSSHKESENSSNLNGTEKVANEAQASNSSSSSGKAENKNPSDSNGTEETSPSSVPVPSINKEGKNPEQLNEEKTSPKTATNEAENKTSSKLNEFEKDKQPEGESTSSGGPAGPRNYSTPKTNEFLQTETANTGIGSIKNEHKNPETQQEKSTETADATPNVIGSTVPSPAPGPGTKAEIPRVEKAEVKPGSSESKTQNQNTNTTGHGDQPLGKNPDLGVVSTSTATQPQQNRSQVTQPAKSSPVAVSYGIRETTGTDTSSTGAGTRRTDPGSGTANAGTGTGTGVDQHQQSPTPAFAAGIDPEPIAKTSQIKKSGPDPKVRGKFGSSSGSGLSPSQGINTETKSQNSIEAQTEVPNSNRVGVLRGIDTKAALSDNPTNKGQNAPKKQISVSKRVGTRTPRSKDAGIQGEAGPTIVASTSKRRFKNKSTSSDHNLLQLVQNNVTEPYRDYLFETSNNYLKNRDQQTKLNKINKPQSRGKSNAKTQSKPLLQLQGSLPGDIRQSETGFKRPKTGNENRYSTLHKNQAGNKDKSCNLKQNYSASSIPLNPLSPHHPLYKSGNSKKPKQSNNKNFGQSATSIPLNFPSRYSTDRKLTHINVNYNNPNGAYVPGKAIYTPDGVIIIPKRNSQVQGKTRSTDFRKTPMPAPGKQNNRASVQDSCNRRQYKRQLKTVAELRAALATEGNVSGRGHKNSNSRPNTNTPQLGKLKNKTGSNLEINKHAEVNNRVSFIKLSVCCQGYH